MRTTAAIALLLLTSACSGRVDPVPQRTVSAAMNSPVVLQAQTPPGAALKRVVRGSLAGTWRTRVEYSDRLDRPDLVALASRNVDTARPSAATLQRSFGTGDVRPYLGVGLAQTDPARLDAEVRGFGEGYAVKGVVGSDLAFTDDVSGFVQYDYAFGAENPVLAERREDHGLRFGLSISLN